MSNMTQERTVINLYSPRGGGWVGVGLKNNPIPPRLSHLHMGFTSGGSAAGVG